VSIAQFDIKYIVTTYPRVSPARMAAAATRLLDWNLRVRSMTPRDADTVVLFIEADRRIFEHPWQATDDLVRPVGAALDDGTFAAHLQALLDRRHNLPEMTVTCQAVRSSSTDDVMAWFFDTAYNGESFIFRHAYYTAATTRTSASARH